MISLNAIEVDDTVIACDKDFAKDYLGYKSRVFYMTDNKGNDKAVYIMPKIGNKEMQIEGDDAEYNSSTNEIGYYDSHNTKKKAALAKNFKIIYNGKADGNYTEILADLKDMHLRFLDNDNDNKFDVLFITKYRDIVVKSINTDDGIIYDYYSGNNNWEYGKLPDGAFEGIKNKNGDEVKFEDIYSGQVLSIVSSKDGEYNEVFALDDSIDGAVQSMNEDNKYVIDGQEYTLSSYYTKYGNQDLYVGASGSFKLDMDGKIAAFTRESNFSLSYGYIDRVWKDEEERVVVKIYTTNRGVSNYICADRLNTGKKSLKHSDNIYTYIAGGGPKRLGYIYR